MKNFKIASIFLAAALNGVLLWSAPSLSAVFAGNAGVSGTFPTDGSSIELQIPMATFAAGQIDFAERFTARGEIEIIAKDFPIHRIFQGNDATIKLHELSLVYKKSAITSTHFLSAFIGSYEPIGCDTFLMRQFGIQPISSPLTKSVTNIAGAPLYSNNGAGLSYISRLESSPVSLGGYLYAYQDSSDRIGASLDFRVAGSFPTITFDFVAGIGAPLKDNGQNEGDDYIIAIKTITLHTGFNMLLGNRYTHGLLLQLGLNNLILSGKHSWDFFKSEFSFLLEPRIRFDTFGLYFTFYALNNETLDSLLYLVDPIGVGVTLFFDSLETSNGAMTAGFHFVTSTNGDEVTFIKLIDPNDNISIKDAKWNFYISPYLEIPFSSSAQLELMGQVALLNVLSGKPDINFKAIAGFRKQF